MGKSSGLCERHHKLWWKYQWEGLTRFHKTSCQEWAMLFTLLAFVSDIVKPMTQSSGWKKETLLSTSSTSLTTSELKMRKIANPLIEVIMQNLNSRSFHHNPISQPEGCKAPISLTRSRLLGIYWKIVFIEKYNVKPFWFLSLTYKLLTDNRGGFFLPKNISE